MERASVSAQGGIKLVDEVNASLGSLLTGIKDLDNINLTVASASEEQKYTCDSTLQNMKQVEQSASELFAASKEVSGASSTLSNIACELQSQVASFK
jgi:methyl-accepting chemotaxis protein